MSTVVYGKDDVTGSNDPVSVTSNTLHVAQFVWDTNTLDWIKQTGGGTTPGTDVTVSNFPATQTIAGSVTALTPTYAKHYDQASASIAYIGEATPGSSNASSVWRIQRLTFTGDNIDIQWAEGNSNFSNSWSNRAAHTYT